MENLLFKPQNIEPVDWRIFQQTDLGKIHRVIPFDELSKTFPSLKHSSQGRKPWFKIQGGLALMFLKSYLDLSDEKLLNRLNTDWAIQYFCGIRLKRGQVIRDKDIISRWRRNLAHHLSIDKLQTIFAKHWKPYMKHRHLLLMDASCYESLVRYPTDVKLLWESVQWMNGIVKESCKNLGIRRPRYKYRSVAQRVNKYQKTRKKTFKARRKIHRSLCYLLNKLIGILDRLLIENELILKPRIEVRFRVIKKVYAQQQCRFTNAEKFKAIKDRIVSIAKPYLRPIVRGKENKRVEFGAKANTFQIDGINFIDHLSYQAFNECTRLEASVWKANKLMHTQMHQLGADQIYATNSNRKYCSKHAMATCFVRKGRPSKNEQQAKILRSTIARGRATVMEGAYGNEKNHYGLRKIKARTESTEILWIFIGIMTANAVNISRRREKIDRQKKFLVA